MTDGMGLKAIIIALATLLSSNGVDAQSATPEDLRVLPFDSLFPLIASVRLDDQVIEPLGIVRAMVVAGGEVVIADRSNGNLKAFDRRTGRLLRTIGRAGNGPGEMRRVAALERDRRGNLYSIDNARKVLIIRDSAGTMLREQKLIGNWTSLTVLDGGSPTVVLTGRAGVSKLQNGQLASKSMLILHETDSTGIRASYLDAVWPPTEWQQTFGDYFSSAMGPVVIAATYGSDSLFFRNWQSGKSWWTRVGAPWMRAIEWPGPDGFGPGTALQQVNRWAKEQTIINKVLGAGKDRFVVQVQTYEGGDEVMWGYVIGGANGHALVTSGRTFVKLQRMQADTAFAIVEDDFGGMHLETRLLTRRYEGR